MTAELSAPPPGRLVDYARLMRLDKPIGVLLLGWPMMWALWLAAGGTPPLKELVVFIAGALLMRSAGCVINDYADRDFDPHVKRTRDRPLAARRVGTREALALFAILCLLAFALAMTLNTLTILLSLPAVVFAASYPFMKRFHSLPQAHLGVAFGWAVPMAYAAILGHVPAQGWLVFAAAVVWAIVYDTEYAMVDRDDDEALGVKSSAILFGEMDRAWIGAFQVLFCALLGWLGASAGLAWPYWAGLAVAIGLSLYQQWLIAPRTRERCFKAFMNNNWLGGFVWLGLVADLAST